MEEVKVPVARAAATLNRFDRMEWAGAFGDLGTLIPFVAAYIGMVGMDPFGILFAFGVALVVCGTYYRTPMPVQPMKAAGAVAATQAAQTAVITPAAVVGAGLATGMIWLILGLSGAARRIAVLVPRFVVVGIVLGLGMAFMLEGVRMMATGWLLATIGLTGTLLLLTNRSIPAMFVLLLFGGACGVIADPSLLQKLGETTIEFRTPSFALSDLTWKEFALGLVFLALPQLPLTLGNAVIGTAEENNRLFPDRPTDENRLSTSTGILNLFGASSAEYRCAMEPEDGGSRRVRGANRRGNDRARSHPSAARAIPQRLRRSAVQHPSAIDPRRNPVHHGRAAGTGFVRFQHGQARAVYHPHHRRVLRLERRPRVPGRHGRRIPE